MNHLSDLHYWIAATHLPGVSVRKLFSWLEIMGDYQSLFESSASDLQAAGFTRTEATKITGLDLHALHKENQIYDLQNEVITLKDPRYPPLLKEIVDPPLVLFVRGDITVLSAPQIAMVGSRNPSPLGQETAEKFAHTLAKQGLVITSGLASGIDSACHQGALLAQGKTIAVMGTGLNQIYPRAHLSLAEKIIQQGAIITEFPFNTPPAAWNFPRRNRIISGLSLGVLVVEAALRSGSLITARFALEQNREVFAIPGSINHPLSRGCHQLIRQGAKLVESAKDILEEIGLVAADMPQKTPTLGMDLAKSDKTLLHHIDYSVTPLDSIMQRSTLTASEVSSILLSLELKGYVQAVQGGYIRCG